MNETDVERSAHALANAVKRIEANLEAFRACLREAGAVGDPRGELREFEGSRQQILETFGLEVPGLDQLPRGGLVARAILADVVSAERYLERNVSPWYAGAGFAWLLESVEELRGADGAPAVLPWPGRQGLFEVDWGADLRAQMQAAGLSWERAA